jgi:flagellar basal-body rod protein FlgB
MPALEMMVRFAGARNRVLTHNIANIDTPDFRPMDASPAAFQRQLSRAIDQRRASTGGERGTLPLESTHEVRITPGNNNLELRPSTPGRGILFHDRNNRDLERMMQDLTENMGMFRISADLLRAHTETLKLAMNER